MFKYFRLLSTFLIVTSAFAQWQALKNTCPANAGPEFLLTDGSVLVQNSDSSDWYKLTPDINGSYVNGTWKKMASMASDYGPEWYGSAVLPSGKLVVVGGEYNQSNNPSWTNLGAIYDPVANTWTPMTGPSTWSQIGDAQSIVLPDGRFMLGDPFGSDAAVLNEATLTWTAIGTGKADRQDEEGWTLLPDGTVLTVDGPNAPNAEKFDIASGKWISAGATPNSLFDPASLETGPQILMPNKTVFCMGGTKYTAIYTPPAIPTDPGSWKAGPTFPTLAGGYNMTIKDGPGCLLPNGNVMCIASPSGPYTFNPKTYVLQYDGVSFSNLPAFPNAPSDYSFACMLLLLPNGQVMLTDRGPDVEIYTPSGGPQNSWRPSITNGPGTVLQGDSYKISGTQFNGLSQGSAYGDDAQNATNYPLVKITNGATHHVFYCRTFDHSTMGISTGSLIVSTNFTVPKSAENGPSSLQVVANGIPSVPITLHVGPGSDKAVTSYTLTSATITGSYGVFGTVQIGYPAPAGGRVVTLSGGDARVSYPATVTVAAGSSTKQFLISTKSVSVNDIETLKAAIGASFKTVTLTVTPSPVSSVTLSPSSVIGGVSSTGTVNLYHAAGPSGDVVSLSGGDSFVAYPANVTVPAGLTSKSFPVTTKPVSSNRMESITAKLGTTSKTGVLTLTPAAISSFTITPSSVKGGANTGGIIHLSNPAGPAGDVVTLSGGDTSVHYPATVTIPAGASGVSFLIATHVVTTAKSETITAKLGASAKASTVKLNP